ncbi:MAG: hypothetical protein WD801_15895 [Gemmatimonadaceae bacterium]
MSGNEGFSVGGACLGLLLLGACARTDPAAEVPSGTAMAESDSVTIARLEREARALARIDGCGSADQCMTAPVGERPCGGPREYLVFCARTTDTAALNRKLAELRTVETAFNQKTGAMSTCEFREPPPTELVAGACRAR